MLPVEELGLPTSAAGAAGATTTDEDSEDDFRYEEEEVEEAADWSTAGPDRPPPGPVGLSDHEFRWYERWLQKSDMGSEDSACS